uniref:7TM_GPCR_Srx domain-containing protein n=1 Tax=Steinernema glaseri TaxID=37863 RepID=A0A1I7YNX4_9BILA
MPYLHWLLFVITSPREDPNNRRRSLFERFSIQKAVFILKVLLILAGMPLNFPLTHNAFVVTGITMEHLQMRSTGASRYN